LQGHLIEPQVTNQELAGWPSADVNVLAREWSAWPAGLKCSLAEGDVNELFARAFDDYSAESDRSLQRTMAGMDYTTRLVEGVMGSSQRASTDYMDISGKSLNPARWYQERVEEHLSEQQQALTTGQSLEVRLILAGGAIILPTWFGYHGPDMLIVDGINEEGRTVRVLLPYTTAQIVFTIVDQAADPRRPAIGFQRRSPDQG
jgi:hypothetical protein